MLNEILHCKLGLGGVGGACVGLGFVLLPISMTINNAFVMKVYGAVMTDWPHTGNLRKEESQIDR